MSHFQPAALERCCLAEWEINQLNGFNHRNNINSNHNKDINGGQQGLTTTSPQSQQQPFSFGQHGDIHFAIWVLSQSFINFAEPTLADKPVSNHCTEHREPPKLELPSARMLTSPFCGCSVVTNNHAVGCDIYPSCGSC